LVDFGPEVAVAFEEFGEGGGGEVEGVGGIGEAPVCGGEEIEDEAHEGKVMLGSEGGGEQGVGGDVGRVPGGWGEGGEVEGTAEFEDEAAAQAGEGAGAVLVLGAGFGGNG
jgi:hypothetical protein